MGQRALTKKKDEDVKGEDRDAGKEVNAEADKGEAQEQDIEAGEEAQTGIDAEEAEEEKKPRIRRWRDDQIAKMPSGAPYLFTGY